MDGIIVVNKPKGITSRDVVNKACKLLNTKKIGHTGTLDPIATGVLVLCVGKATKLVEVLTDTLDTDGTIIEKKQASLDKNELENVLKSFIGMYNQEVPIYSAVKINGKKLYEYAREKKEVMLPKRMVEIKDIKLLELNNNYYKFKVSVSKGTYIRSLIKDINEKLRVIGVMSDLIRTRQGKFLINDSYSLEDMENNNYNVLTITDVLKDENCVIIDSTLFKKVKNGAIINNKYNTDMVTFIYKDNVIAIYKTYDKDKNKMKPYKMFI